MATSSFHLPAPAARLSTTSAGGDSTTASSASASVEAAPRPTQKFNLELFRPSLKKLLHDNLAGSAWDKDKERQRKLTRALADAVKGKMLDQEPQGFKYLVQVQLAENRGQGGR